MGMRVYLIRGFDNYVAPPRHFRSRVRLVRETARRELVVQRRHSFNATPVYSYTTDWDLIGRPTNAVDSLSSARAWRYNRRSELVGATIGTNLYIPCYDHNGNIVCYVSEAGIIAGQFLYDPYGNVIDEHGAQRDAFA